MNNREKTALKTMEYNRYILIRYSLALFFFANLNWSLLLFLQKSIFFLIPLLLTVCAIFPIYEQIKLYSAKEHNFQSKYLKKYFITQLIFNIILAILSFFRSFYQTAFSFMANNLQGFSGVVSILGVGAVLSIVCLRKLNKINNKEDKKYKEVIKYKKYLGVYE